MEIGPHSRELTERRLRQDLARLEEILEEDHRHRERALAILNDTELETTK